MTVPSGDIAENAYFKRDIRRSYPRLSVVNQADVVGLLSFGSKSNPRDEVLQIGQAGTKQMVQVREEAEGSGGLSQYFEKRKDATTFGDGGLPPLPTGMNREFTCCVLRLVTACLTPRSRFPYNEQIELSVRFGIVESSNGSRKYIVDVDRENGYPEE